MKTSISLENASYDMVNSHVSSFHHIELIAELAYWSIDELLCHLLNELHSHEIHASSSSLKCPKSSPLWLKYLQLISSLLGDCFHHILCIINDKNVSSNHSSGVNQVLHNSPLNDLIHAYLVIGLTECAHVITRLAHTFAQAIQFKLNSLSVTLVNQIDNVNYLFQVCEPNTNCDLFPSPNDTNMDADKADEQVSNTNDHPYQCDQNGSEDEEKNDIAKAEWRFLCNLPEVQLSGSISLFELACDCLLPNIYPTLFGLFKAQYSMLDQSYWIYCQALHCKSDSILYSYLELDQNLWLWEPSSSSESTLPLSERYSAFHPAVDILRKLSQKITPTEKLLIIYQTFATVDHIVSKSELSRHPTQETSDESHSCRNLSICSVDTLLHLPGLDQLLPIIQFVVIRAGIMYLGAELAYIEQLAPERLSLTGLLPYLMTTMQACYDQILREDDLTSFSKNELQHMKISWDIITSMGVQIPPIQGVHLVSHWFSEWNGLERELFLSTLSCLEEISCYSPTESSSSSTTNDGINMFNNHACDNADHQMTDTFLAHLMDSNLRINSQLTVEKPNSCDIFQCQIRLFRNWYPQWPMEQRVQLAGRLKDIQLRSINV
ncbi:unnamed protein product [Heterobilharzia americana]|nr:unnamed protein product [Heterobilharzia americana]